MQSSPDSLVVNIWFLVGINYFTPTTTPLQLDIFKKKEIDKLKSINKQKTYLDFRT